jgi:GPN-loop GTPase
VPLLHQTQCVGISALTGAGMEEFFEKVHEAAQEYEEVYLPHLEEQKKFKAQRELERQRESKERMDRDMGDDVILDSLPNSMHAPVDDAANDPYVPTAEYDDPDEEAAEAAEYEELMRHLQAQQPINSKPDHKDNTQTK